MGKLLNNAKYYRSACQTVWYKELVVHFQSAGHIVQVNQLYKEMFLLASD